jgi:hypothetical protein
MSSENKIPTNKRIRGYYWVDKLVNELLPYVKDDAAERFPSKHEFLKNLVRGYVPAYFEPQIPDNRRGAWIVPDSWRLEYRSLEKEIEDIGRAIAHENSGMPNTSNRNMENRLNKIFRRHGWIAGRRERATHVKGISPFDKRGEWRYDAIKNKVAIEVELSSRSQVFKDAFKFLIGQATGQIDVGIIVVRKHKEKDGLPYLGSVELDSHAIHKTLPMLTVAFYGFPNKADKQKNKPNREISEVDEYQ